MASDIMADMVIPDCVHINWLNALRSALIGLVVCVHFIVFHGFRGLFTDTSEHIRFYLLVFLFFQFFVVGSVR